MPAKGKHRRPRPGRLARGIAVAGTGGAALALPLVGAANAHAADATHTYTVERGDSLASIARAQHTPGGWQRLYQDNHQAIGDNPRLIHPGLKLVLDGAAKPSTASATTAAATTGTGYTLPVKGATLGTPWGQAGSMWSSGHHTGQDFVVPSGTPVHALADGTVVTAGWGGAYGNQVVIEHADGKYTQYAHMTSLNVSAGQTVTEGTQLGVSGATGNVTGPHLHFEVRTGPDYGSDVDPVAYLRAHGVDL
ncbi:peptidoglycan DD-metalloendopeptidase family protein [Streptomyces sp. NPDC050560]|uniref:M23 family metallopeptidase n=1 Tax=Streptomyces sp. NPDC050560 TaxID=3365630 RepID=UPI003795A2AE